MNNIIILSEVDQERRDTYMKYYNEVLLTGASGFKILEPEKEFDENGLRFPVDYLNKLGINAIFFPLEILATYADIVTVTKIEDQEFIYRNIIDYDLAKDFDIASINATALGNLAYVFMHCKIEKAKVYALEFLNKVFVKAMGAMLNYVNENL